LPDSNIYSPYTSSYQIIETHDYTFRELQNEGINTLARQLDVLHVPIRQFKFAIKAHINRHHFAFTKEKRKKATFRAISFSYPSFSPQGDPVMLSGLVTIPLLTDNRPSRMLIYNRLTCISNRIAPSNSLPLEAIITADNTICVFPDYYGCGTTEGNPLPFIALNYHARCATECVLTALDIIHDNGIALDTGFYTWNTGYSQGGGYALATLKYIENCLPDSIQQRINLRWTLCGGGIYAPAKLYELIILNGNMGSTPSVILQGLRSLLNSHPEMMENISLSDIFSEKAKETGIDSIFLTYDDGVWDFVKKLDGRDKSHNPADFFSPSVLDTSSIIYKKIIAAFSLDDCVSGWHPKSLVVLSHSKKDQNIPARLTLQAHSQLSLDNNNCILHHPPVNKSHLHTGFLYFCKILRLNEDELYRLYYLKNKNRTSM
jgi:hypothetical protein